MNKELPFKCDSCFVKQDESDDDDKWDYLKFKTTDWNAVNGSMPYEEDSDPVVDVMAKCPKCGVYAHKYFTPADIFTMLMQTE